VRTAEAPPTPAALSQALGSLTQTVWTVAVRHDHAAPIFVDEKHLETGVVDLLVRPEAG
jgi:hypothetical protein